MTTVVVPKLPVGVGVLLDRTHAYGVGRSDIAVDVDDSGDAFRHDAVDIRVKARLVAVILAPDKSASTLSVTPA